MDYDSLTWCYKSVDFIILKHLAYNINADSIVIKYPDTERRWKHHFWDVSLSSLANPYAAERALAKVSSKPWGTEHVIEAVKRVHASILEGNPICRVYDGPEPFIPKKRGGKTR